MAANDRKDATETSDVKDGAGTDSREESISDVEVQGDYGSGRDHIFSDTKVADYWRNIYENAKYEGSHRFDPAFTWTAQEELRVRRKVDLRVMVWCWLMFVALDLNRRNINRAISDDMLEELGMDTNDYNYGQTIFLVSFLAAELPSGLISKKLGPDIWIPFIITSWSIISAAQAGLTNKTGYYVCRCLLGLLMGGFIPDTVLYMTYWYKTKELPIRLSWFWTVLSTCNIIGSLLAAGILQMRGLQGWSGWQWLFLIEGCITTVIGVASWAIMPPGPCQTAGRLRGKGWFNEHEEKILVNRILRDDPSKGDMHNRQGVNLQRLWKCLKDYDLWPLYIVGLTNYIPPNPPQNYLSYILRQMGFSTFEANLLTIPSQFLFGVNLLIISWISERVNERAIVSSFSNIWILPWLAALVGLGARASEWVRYALLTGLLSYPYCHAILVAWNSRNSNSVRTRAVSAALYNMFVQAGNIIGSNIYREDDRPLYQRGNKILLAICCFNVVLLYVVKYYYVAKNKRREEAWAKLTGEEKIDYIQNTKDEGAKRLDFRFTH
ncbi:major facilitator superfamily domain-containing protein [Macrophomina phaseolina]|uniref:Major facilitator superfamily domain-containing protein n=1 Tax=Macrophomina phaseolina TaxID=35725 RepID=A0ABQ8GIF3_9PEZI|nr:major facilitator superfamily domain-containing protein [Macrophomina phaseolina]